MSSEPKLSGFNKLAGYTVERMQDGESEVHLQVGSQHLNSAGIVHGGMLATLLDVACGASAHSLVPREKFAPTSSMSISYMNAVSEGLIVTKARALKNGAKIISCEAEAFCGDLLLAKALINMVIVERRKTAE